MCVYACVYVFVCNIDDYDLIIFVLLFHVIYGIIAPPHLGKCYVQLEDNWMILINNNMPSFIALVAALTGKLMINKKTHSVDSNRRHPAFQSTTLALSQGENISGLFKLTL